MIRSALIAARRALLALAATVAFGLAASGAEAATTCKFADGVLEVHMASEEDAASFSVAAGAIQISSAQGGVFCAGATPTTTITDAVLVVDDSDEPGTPDVLDGDTRIVILDPANFAPGATPEADGASEIEFYAETKAGDDSVSAASSGGPAAQSIVAGNGGLSWTADADADLSGMPFDHVFLGGGPSSDLLSGQGGRGTGAPLSLAARFIVLAHDGPDRLLGSDIADGDVLQSGSGDDPLEGGAGTDALWGGPGSDAVTGGPGLDTIQFDSNGGGVTVDLARTGPQDTNDGTDTLTEVENAVGTDFADRLAGTAGANVLDGGEGDDTLTGRGGGDVLQGRDGTDAVSYADAPAGVALDLARTTQPTGGDQLVSIEDAIGSPFADTISGNDLANRIVGGGGADVIAAGDGDDRIEARDSEGDRASCGAGSDTAISDRRSLDALDADCETVDALPEPDRQGGGGGRQPDTTLSFRLSGAKRQRLARLGAIRIRLQAPLEDATAVASAAGRAHGTKLRVRPRTFAVPAGPAHTVALRLTRTQRRAIRAALADGKRPRLSVAVQATDTAGNTVNQTLRVTAKR